MVIFFVCDTQSFTVFEIVDAAVFAPKTCGKYISDDFSCNNKLTSCDFCGVDPQRFFVALGEKQGS
jgi:hypothetical protein